MIEKPPENRCAIWGTPARATQISSLSWEIDSPRAGGPYLIDLLTFNRLPTDNLSLRARLTTWLVDQRRAGVSSPQITSEAIRRAQGVPALRFSERIDRLFLYLNSIRLRPGGYLSLTKNEQAVIHPLAAWTESETDEEIHALLNMLRGEGLLQTGIPAIALTGKGFERLEAVEHRSVTGVQAFVAMWFGRELDEAYANGFGPGIADAGFRAFRIDEKEHSNKIDDEIIAEIRRSRFVVADFTCPLLELGDGRTTASPRGGVYYEAGFAQGLGIPVIWTVRADCIDYVHFDTRQFAHIVWKEPGDLRVGLKNRIGAVIGPPGR